MKKLFEIFKSGTRTDNNGRKVTITDADVAQAAAAYDPKLHEAPLVIGHPKTDAPAYGWVGSLQADGGVLSADFVQMDDDFVGLVKDGRYKRYQPVSIRPTARVTRSQALGICAMSVFSVHNHLR